MPDALGKTLEHQRETESSGAGPRESVSLTFGTGRCP